MRFNSLIYWLFLAAAVMVLWLLPARARGVWLLVASYAFYGSWHYPYLLLLVATTLMNHLGARWIVAGERRRRGIAVLCANLVILALFKYLDWLVANLNMVGSLFGADGLPLPGWVLPLGLSFYVFECMSYIVDLMRQREVLHGFWDFQLYITFFPHLIAGPIMRAKEFIPQLKKELATTAADLRRGLAHVIAGMFTKVILADGLAENVDRSFARAPHSLSSLDVALMAVAFGLQIYFDFSSYTQIAIGSARMCGLDLVENFNHPYVARSPADFWNRWHMSLSRWIRDYLFYPLTGKKATLGAMSKAVIISMVLCGVWHGAGWTFVLWGLYHGLLIAAYHALTLGRRKQPKPAREATALRKLTELGGILVTFGLVMIGWLFFRSQSVEQCLGLFGVLLTPWAHHHRALSGLFYLHVAVLTAAVWALPQLSIRVGRLWESRPKYPVGFAIAEGIGAGVMIAVCLVYLRAQSSFIYFQF